MKNYKSIKIKSNLSGLILFILLVAVSSCGGSRVEYNNKVKSLSCDGEVWYYSGKNFVNDSFALVEASISLDEGIFDRYKLPETAEDIDCDWAKDFHYYKSDYLRSAGIYLQYPANDEYVDCFCKGFVEAAEKYLSK